MILQMVPRDPLGLHPGAGLGIKQQGVQLFHLGPCLDELCRHQMGLCRGGGKAEAAGIGGETGVQAVGNVGRHGHFHGHDDLIQQLRCRRGLAVQQGKISVAAIARVVVDAKINVAGILGHPVVLTKELDAGHIHGHHGLGLKLALEQAWVGKRIPGGDDVGAEDSRVFVQRLKGVVQRAAAANGITIRVFVAQNQNIVRSTEALGHLLHVQLFCHPMIHPFRKAELVLGFRLPRVVGAADIQLAEQFVDVGRIGCTVVFHKEEAGGFADVHFLADFGAHMAGRAVQRLNGGLGAVGVAHHTHIDLGNIQVGRHVQAGHGQQTTLQAGIFQAANDGDDLTLHILRKTAHIFLRHLVSPITK